MAMWAFLSGLDLFLIVVLMGARPYHNCLVRFFSSLEDERFILSVHDKSS